MPSKIWNPVRLGIRLGASIGLLSALLATGQAPSFRNLPADAYRPGRVVLIPKAGRNLALEQFHRSRGAKLHRRFPAFRDTEVVELPPGADTLKSIEEYQRSGLVEVAEPDILFRPAVLPNDPMLLNGDQWPLHNTGQFGGLPDADIDAPEAWDRFNSASNIIVAIIDSGARYTHQDLAANMWVNPGEIAGNGIDDDGNGIIDDVHGIDAVTDTGSPLDDRGHGTHVAGIIGAVGNNGVGTCGVAWRVRIMALRFLPPPPQLGTLTDLLQCMNYAQIKGAQVMNCSFTTSTFSLSMSNAFWSVREAGIVVTAAAGNEGWNTDTSPIYPACIKLDNIVSVTASTKTDAFSGYNYGLTSVHLAAPGTSIWSTYNRSDSDYEFQTGTSMASPHVAGALALMRAKYPQLTPPQLISRLLAATDPLPSLAGRCVSGGRLNLDRAVGPRDYKLGPALFAWVPTNGLTPLSISTNEVSPPLALPFVFSFYGRTQSQVYVSANGIVGFDSVGLGSTLDSLLPSPAITPNGALYPYWDDLNPAPGQVWVGAMGAAPNRKYVVSWANVPHSLTTGGETYFTVQAILHETGEITFQYLDVTNGRSTLISGRSASVGIEDYLGQTGVAYTFHGSLNGTSALLTNEQALVFSLPGAPAVGPTLQTLGVSGGRLKLRLCAQPGLKTVLSAGPDPASWHPIATNSIPASGLLEVDAPATGSAQFYRARAE